MGFSSILDLISSTLIGGYVLLLLMRINGASTESSFSNSEEVILQKNLSTVAQIVEYDFRKIGFCLDWKKIPDPSKSIIIADSNRIKFLTDVDVDGNLDTMYYYLGPKSELSSTSNPNDRFLYRVVNGETPIGTNQGITEFKLIYLDASNDTLPFPITNPSEISSMEINIAVEKIDAYGSADKAYKYSGAFWRQIRLVARNLKNR